MTTLNQYRMYLKENEIGISIYAETMELNDDCIMFCIDGRCVVCIGSERVEKINMWDRQENDDVEVFTCLKTRADYNSTAEYEFSN